MDKKLKLNFVYNFVTQLLTVLSPLIIAPYISRVLDIKLIGDYNYCYSIVSIFGLFANMGITVYGVPIIAKDKESKSETSKSFFELMLIKCIFAFLSICIYFLLVFTIFEENYIVYFSLFSIYILASFFDITWFFQAMEDFKIICLRTFLVKGISIIAIFSFIKSTSDMNAYIFITMIALLIPNLLLFCNLKNRIEFKKTKLNLKQHVKPIFEMLLPGIAYTFYAMLDKAMIKFITGDTIEVGFYEQAYKIAFVAITVISVFSTVLSTRISALKSDKEIKDMHKYSYAIICIITIPVFIGLFNLSDYFIPLYYGDGYEGSILILKLFSVLPFIIGISNFVSYQYFVPKLITKPSMIIITISILVNCIFNAFLIKILGGAGAAISTIISELFISSCYLILYFKYQKISVVLKCIYKYFIAGFITFIMTFISIRYYIACTNFTIFILYVMLILVIFMGLLVVLKEEIVLNILKFGKNKLRGYNLWKKQA